MDGREAVKNVGIAGALFIGVFVFLIGASMLNGWMLSYMWQWFVVPLGVRSISIPQAMGISIIASILTHEFKKDEDDEFFSRLIKLLVARAVVFGIAYMISFWVVA